MTEGITTNVGPDQQSEAHDIAREHAVRVAEGARNLQASINALGAGPKKPPSDNETWWDGYWTGYYVAKAEQSEP